VATCSARSVLRFILTGGNVHDSEPARRLLDLIYSEDNHYLAMDRAYEGDETRVKAVERGFIPVVPPKSNCKELWDYDKEIYKRRNEVERFFLLIKKRFRKVFTRYDKLDSSYIAVFNLAMIFDALISVNKL
jgi:transposase